MPPPPHIKPENILKVWIGWIGRYKEAWERRVVADGFVV